MLGARRRAAGGIGRGWWAGFLAATRVPDAELAGLPSQRALRGTVGGLDAKEPLGLGGAISCRCLPSPAGKI